jgi:aldose 1-epimerase
MTMSRWKEVVLIAVFLLGVIFAPQPSAAGIMATIQQEAFGKTPDGKAVTLYTLTNSKGLEARIMTYGGILVSLKTPDRDGKMGDITLGYDDLDGYVKNNPYFGALIGRYGNRIGKGIFALHGRKYHLAVNNGKNHLHGGVKGFDKVVWKAKPLPSVDGAGLRLTYRSKNGEEGYPGNLAVTVVYRLTDGNELKIDYSASCDRDTVVNLTHHSYFNLTGKGNILDHRLMIKASRFTPVDEGLIPTGELRKVVGTPFDFLTETPIGSRIGQEDEQLKFGKGYDHNWVLDRDKKGLSLAARLHDPKSGRVVEVLTTEPGLQFYSGNFLDGSNKGKGGRVYKFRNGLCLETQHYPDSPNQKAFQSTVLKKGRKYSTHTVYKFSAE